MTLIVEDRVAETSTTTGTGALTLAGAITGYRTFSSVCSVGDICYYTIEAVDGSGTPTGAFETGIGTYSAASTLTRTTISRSSNANAAVSFAAGTKRVYISATQAFFAAKFGRAWWWAPPLAASFTDFRSGDATTVACSDDADNGMVLSGGNLVAGPVLRTALQSITAAQDWTIIAHYNFAIIPANFDGVYLCAIESSTNKGYLIGQIFNSGELLSCRSIASLATTGTGRGEGGGGWMPFHFKIKHVESTRTISCHFSIDGKNWVQRDSVADTSIFTARADLIGLLFMSQNGGGQAMFATCDRWSFSSP